MTAWGILLNSLYWLGVALVLTGLLLRFMVGMPRIALPVAVTGAAILLVARVNSALRPRKPIRREDLPRGGGGLKLD